MIQTYSYTKVSKRRITAYVISQTKLNIAQISQTFKWTWESFCKILEVSTVSVIWVVRDDVLDGLSWRPTIPLWTFSTTPLVQRVGTFALSRAYVVHVCLYETCHDQSSKVDRRSYI